MGGCVKREIGFEVLDNRIPIKIEDVMDVKETPDGEFADKESVLDDEKDIKPNDDLLNKLRTKRRVKIPPNDDDVIKGNIITLIFLSLKCHKYLLYNG